MTLEFPDGKSGPKKWRSGRTLTLVGQDASCRLRLDDPSVSRHHCALLRTPAGIWAVDLLGRDGIRVNGDSVRWAQLFTDDELSVGGFRIVLRQGSTPHLPGRLAEDLPLHDASTSGTPVVLPLREVETWLIPSATPDRDRLLPAGDFESTNPQLASVIQLLGFQPPQAAELSNHPLTLLIRVFGELHRQQSADFREELERLGRMVQELIDLKGETEPNRRILAAPSEADKTLTPSHRDDSVASSPPPKSHDKSEGDLYRWLNERIVATRDENPGRWQKLLGKVTGGGNGEVKL